MPEEVGLQGGVPVNGQADPVGFNGNPFEPANPAAVSKPQDGNVDLGFLGLDKPKAKEPEKDDPNDAKRYAYWQSQAAIRDNELQRVRAEKDAMAAQQMQLMSMIQQSQNHQTPQDTTPKPPVAPTKPSRPRDFSREEALADPKSESAKFLDEQDLWREQMDNYNTQLLDYERSKLASEKAQYDAYMRELAVQQQTSLQYQQAEQLLQEQYQFTPAQAREFVQTYADPKNVTMDNLVALYRASKSAPPAQQFVQPMYSQPSQAFQQVQRGQQLVPPMGVMPAAGQQTTAQVGGAFMDALIGSRNPKNIFGT